MSASALYIILVGPGLVGRQVLAQLQGYGDLPGVVPVVVNGSASGNPALLIAGHSSIMRRFPALEVVGIVSSSRMLVPVDPTTGQPRLAALPLDHWWKWWTEGSLGSVWSAAETTCEAISVAVPETGVCVGLFRANLDAMLGLFLAQRSHSGGQNHSAGAGPSVQCVVVDCTSSELLALRYPSLLRQGIHIVTPNKKAFSGDYALYRDIVRACRKTHSTPYPFCLHEATVGAGLPILSTLRDLLLTGDKVVRIEGVLSGTLSYLFNEFSAVPNPDSPMQAKRTFSEIVAEAKRLGYTEPDPRDDLNGMDVARKVVILSRVAGMDLNLETLPVENIVPPALRAVDNVDEFMKRLPESDAHFDALLSSAHSKGKVLRLVGVMSGVTGKDGRSSEVKLKSYPYAHPFAQLRGSDNIVAFYTERYPERPLIVQGSGAGAAVTASGVLSDLIKIGETVLYNR